MDRKEEPWVIYRVKEFKDSINPKPAYQTGPRWSLSQKQLLIDTILRYYDIPKFYLREVSGSPYEYDVVDGQQRLRAIWEFLEDRWPLAKDAEPVDGQNAAGKYWSQLPAPFRDKKILSYQLSVVVFYNATEDEVEEMFVRLQNGTTLTAAEKRNALPGRMKTFVRDLANHPFFASVGFQDKRYAFQDTAAQMVLLESNSGPCDTRDRDLRKMYQEYREFSVGSRLGKTVRKVLGFLHKAFPEKTPELTKTSVVPLYLMASRLLQTYPFSDRHDDLRRWFIEFEQRRRADEEKDVDDRDPDLVIYQERTRQATHDKDSIEFRYRVLMGDLLLTCQDMEPLDAQRGFTHEQRLAIYRKFDGVCQKCSEKVAWDDFHADHIVAHARGGKTTINNAQLLCSKCNRLKATS